MNKGHIGYSPDFKSDKPTYQELVKKSWDVRYAAGFRAGVEAVIEILKNGELALFSDMEGAGEPEFSQYEKGAVVCHNLKNKAEQLLKENK